MSNAPPRRQAGAFTLIELLVVVAVIGILASLLMPVVVKGMTSAMTTSCKSALSQIGATIQMYKQNNFHMFLRHGQIRWQDDGVWAGRVLRPAPMMDRYLAKESEVWICAADSATRSRGTQWWISSYTCNALLNGVSDSAVERPSRTISVLCGPHDGGWIELKPPWSHDDSPFMHPTWSTYNRHDGRFNALYYDRHVELLTAAETAREDFEPD